MKIYEYKDLLVQVPAGVTHLMIGADGVLRGYRNRPDMSLPRPWETTDSIIPGVLNWENHTLRLSRCGNTLRLLSTSLRSREPNVFASAINIRCMRLSMRNSV